MTIAIYKIVNNVNGKSYVGSSVNVEKRFIAHKRALRRGNHINFILQSAWNKYGEENFSFEIVINFNKISSKRLRLIEEEYLQKTSFETNYNISKKSSGGDIVSYHPKLDDIKKKISTALIKRYQSMSESDREKLKASMTGENNPMYGKTHSEEARRKISECSKKWNNENINFRKGKTLEESMGAEVAAKIKNKLSKFASSRTGGKNPFYGKSHSKETRDKIRRSRIGKSPKNIISIIIDEVEYSSMAEASKKLSIPITTIRWRVLSKNKKFSNYRFKL